MIDSVPQGNYFHITAQSMNMTIKERIRVIPYEMCVGGGNDDCCNHFYMALF